MREDRHLPENIVNSKSLNNDFKLTKLDKKMIDAGNNSAKFSDSLENCDNSPEAVKARKKEEFLLKLNIALEIAKKDIANSKAKLTENKENYNEDQETYSLRSHQLEVFEKIKDFIEDGGEKGYLELPTGYGKTVLFVELAEAIGLKTLIVVPWETLIGQTLEKIQSHAPKYLGLNDFTKISQYNWDNLYDFIDETGKPKIINDKDINFEKQFDNIINKTKKIIGRAWDTLDEEEKELAKEIIKSGKHLIEEEYLDNEEFYFKMWEFFEAGDIKKIEDVIWTNITGFSQEDWKKFNKDEKNEIKKDLVKTINLRNCRNAGKTNYSNIGIVDGTVSFPKRMESEEKDLTITTYDSLVLNFNDFTGVEGEKKLEEIEENITNLNSFLKECSAVLDGSADSLSYSELSKKYKKNLKMAIEMKERTGITREYLDLMNENESIKKILDQKDSEKKELIEKLKSLTEFTETDLIERADIESFDDLGGFEDFKKIINIKLEDQKEYKIAIERNRKFGYKGLDASKYDLIILDEAHRGLTNMRKNTINNKFKDAINIGVTATPGYGDKKDRKVSELLPDCIAEVTFLDAIKKEILCPLRYKKIEMEKMENPVEKFEYVYNLYRDNFTNQVEEKKKNLNGLIFTKTVKESEALAEFFAQRGIEARAIHSKTLKKDEDLWKQEYKKGKIQVLISPRKLGEGFDAPNASVSISLHSTKSKVVARQKLGRIARLWSKNPNKIAYAIDLFVKGKNKDGKIQHFDEVFGVDAVFPEENAHYLDNEDQSIVKFMNCKSFIKRKEKDEIAKKEKLKQEKKNSIIITEEEIKKYDKKEDVEFFVEVNQLGVLYKFTKNGKFHQIKTRAEALYRRLFQKEFDRSEKKADGSYKKEEDIIEELENKIKEDLESKNPYYENKLLIDGQINYDEIKKLIAA